MEILKILEEIQKTFGVGKFLWYGVAIYALFSWLDKEVENKETRDAIAIWIKSFKVTYNTDALTKAMLDVFNGLYTNPLLS